MKIHAYIITEHYIHTSPLAPGLAITHILSPSRTNTRRMMFLKSREVNHTPGACVMVDWLPCGLIEQEKANW